MITYGLSIVSRCKVIWSQIQSVFGPLCKRGYYWKFVIFYKYSPYLIQDYAHSGNGRRIGTHMQSIEFCHFQWPWMTPNPYLKAGLARKYQWYISTIYIVIVPWYFQPIKRKYYDIFDFLYFQNTNLYYYYLLIFLIHAHPTQTAQVHKLLNGAKILPKILTLWVGRNNVTDYKHRRTAHAIRRT